MFPKKPQASQHPDRTQGESKRTDRTDREDRDLLVGRGTIETPPTPSDVSMND
jgi:hypothetical protein